MQTNHISSKGNPRVVVAMSGGVDSSVAAALLVERGYDVVGMMLRLWSEPGRAAFNRCCTPDQLADARRIAAQLRIPFYAVDVQDYFRQTIVQFFLDQHTAGMTPNPCIECNRHIRFGFLLDQARALGADYLATGHYARIRHSETEGYQLLKGRDEHKDQSYVLHVMGQAELAQVLFPVGEYNKAEVRDLARRLDLPVAHKSDSMDLCFLGKDDYRAFLRRNSVTIATPGPIETVAGEQIGTHEGLPYYTIGQRKGLGISGPHPLFVVRKDATRNALVVGMRSQLGRTTLRVQRVNWIAGEPFEPVRAEVKIRYNNRPNPSLITPLPDQQAIVTFDEPVTGVAPGQGAVFYQGDCCLGGGLILAENTELDHTGDLSQPGVVAA
jgi:tRNA-specific 2-thiouridylase